MIAKRTSYLQLVIRQYRSSKLNQLGLVIILFMFLVAWLAPILSNDQPLLLHAKNSTTFPILTTIWPFKNFVHYPELQGVDFKKLELASGEWKIMPLFPYSPTEYNLDAPLQAPSHKHWMGTDEQGRDIMSRMIYGARISLSVGFVAVGIYVVVGVILGALAGYYGGRVDMLLSRIIEVMICFPTFFLILAVLAFVEQSIYNIMIVIGLTGWPGIARLVRGEFLKLRSQEFVVSIQAAGGKIPRILFKHILPNAMAPVMVSVSFDVASAILLESSLSFLGFGVQPPTPSWGDILSQSRDFMDIAWWLTVFPGIAIFMTITAFNLVGEGLRDAIDPRLKT